MDISSLKTVRIIIGNGDATVYGSENEIAHISGDVLSRSRVLQQALSDTSQDDVCLSMPQSVLEAWLAGLDMLADHEQYGLEGILGGPFPETFSEYLSEGITYRRLQCSKVHECIQAADFLDDPETLARLSQVACYRLFPVAADSPRSTDWFCFEIEIDHEAAELVQELSELPSHLQQAVLSSSHVLLHAGAHLLPEDLQEAAVHAAHPSISASCCIKVPYLRLGMDTYLQAVGNMLSLRELNVEAHPSELTAAMPRIGNLVNLRTLICHWSQPDTQGALTAALALMLPRLSGLHHLSLWHSHIHDGSAVALVASMAKLTSITHLDVHDSWPGASCWDHLASKPKLADIRVLACVLPQLTGLQFLNISKISQGADGGEYLGEHLARCSSLQDLRMNGTETADRVIRAISGSLSLTHLEAQDSLWSCDLTNHFHMLSTLRSLKVGLCFDDDEDLYDTEDWAPRIIPEECICKLSLLQELEVVFDCNRMERMESLALYITKLCCLTALHIAGPFIFEDEGNELADLVCGCTCLKVVRLKEVSWDDDPVPGAFMTRLFSMSTLHEIELLTGREVGCAYFSAAVMNLRSLTLEFATDTIPAHFAIILDAVPDLTRLDLRDNNFYEPSHAKLAGPIGDMTDLQALSFAGCDFVEAAWVAILAQMANLVHLQDLDVRLSTEFRIQHHHSLAQLLGSSSSLTKLHLPATFVVYFGEDLGPGLEKLKNLRELVVDTSGLETWDASCLAPHISHLTELQRIYTECREVSRFW